jgi:hypothetical protein
MAPPPPTIAAVINALRAIEWAATPRQMLRSLCGKEVIILIDDSAP